MRKTYCQIFLSLSLRKPIPLSVSQRNSNRNTVMMDERSQVFFALVRVAMGIGQIDSMSMSIPWREMYRLAWQQSMTGVLDREGLNE